jgi:hypothetical protein
VNLAIEKIDEKLKIGTAGVPRGVLWEIGRVIRAQLRPHITTLMLRALCRTIAHLL